ncbi:MAG: ankyrin repeat domain-containing protein [Pseudomonadota bacterium]
MDDAQFRQLIESGDRNRLSDALAANPSLTNRPVKWALNQDNESDPLHYACDCVFNGWLDEARAYEVAALLLEHGALIEGTEGKESPLIAATSLGVETVARLFVDAGADLESTSIFGARALHWAASVGLPATAQLLVDRGAELEAKCTEFGATPLYWAVAAFGPHGPAKKRDPLGAAKVLIQAGASADTTNKLGVSALECSRDAASSDMTELLTQYVDDGDGAAPEA